MEFDNTSRFFPLLIIFGAVLVVIYIVGIIPTSIKSKDKPLEKIDLSNAQILEIAAKGGYTPQDIEAKAEISSILRVSTNNTFDCSSSISIPKISVNQILPVTGVTELVIPPQKAGSIIEGTCSMGMYGFKIAFK